MGVIDKSPQWMGISLKSLSLGLLTLQFSSFTLLLHYSRVMPTDGHRYLPSTAVFLVELLKIATCLPFSLFELYKTVPRSMPATALFAALGNALFSGDSYKLAFPAGLYTLANSLQYIAISQLDAATFQVLYQLKIIFTAIFAIFILRRAISARQWVSLILLMFGVQLCIPQGTLHPIPSSHHTRVYQARAVNPILHHLGWISSSARLGKRSATYEGIAEDEMALDNTMTDASVGILAVVGVTLCSALAGIYFEKVMKEAPKAASIWTRNIQLSIYSLFPAFFIGVIFLDGETVAKNGFFDGYNWIVALSIVVQVLGGIIAAMCLFYADNISKNFAVSCSMVLSSLASVLFFNFVADFKFLTGTVIVIIATYMYSMQEVKQQWLPEIRVPGYEKMTIDIPPVSPSEERDVSIQLPRTPLVSNAALSTSRPASPGKKLRKSDSTGYFMKIHD